MSAALFGVTPLLLAAVIFTLTGAMVHGFSLCPAGCVCRGRQNERNAAICTFKYDVSRPPVFRERILSLELRYMTFEDMATYLSATPDLRTLTIYPIPMDKSKRIPEDVFEGLQHLESLKILPTKKYFAPKFLFRLVGSLKALKEIDFSGNRLRCDCRLPDVLASQNIYIKDIERMLPVRHCRSSKGFSAKVYSIPKLIEECERQGGYDIPQGQAAAGAGTQVGNVGLRKFGNVKDRENFDVGVKYKRHNTGSVVPSNVQAAPKSFGGNINTGATGDMGNRRALLQGFAPARNSGNVRGNMGELYRNAITNKQRRGRLPRQKRTA